MKLSEALEVLKKRAAWIKAHFDESSHAEAIDTVVTHCEQKTYTPAEMESFWIWANDNGWYYGTLVELWANDGDPDRIEYTIEDVIEKWEETK